MTSAKILVVEDESIVAKDIAETLKSQGYDVPAIALSGEEAIQKTGQIRPDLVLMDIVLKGDVDGIAAAERIRDRFGIPVVYLTAYADNEIVKRARITEPFGYIIKPFEARELRTNIEMALYRHKAEEAVRRSKQQWETTFNAMSDWVVLIDLKGRILRTNRIGENFTGKTLDEIIGQSCCKLVHGSEEHIPGCPLRIMLHTRQRSTAELNVPNTNRWLMVTVDPVVDEKGNLTGAVHVTRDITNRKKAEKTIRDSEERYKYLFEQSPLGIGLATPDGRVVHVNKTMEVITGYFKEELKKINLADIYENPQDRKKLLETIERYGCAVDFPARLKRKDGTLFDALLNVSRVKLGGRELFQTICTDITERKRAEEKVRESEEKYRGIFDESIATVYVFDAKKNFIDSNQAGLDLLGYSREELLNMSIPDVDADPVVVLPAHEKLLSGERIINYEHQLRRKDDRIISVLNNSRPLTDADGNVIGIQSTLVDITERKRAEEALRKSEEKYRSIYNTAASLIVSMDTSGVIRDCNTRIMDILGYEKEEIIGQSIAKIIHPDYMEKAQDCLNEILVKGIAHNKEYKMIRKDNQIIDVEVNAAGIKGREGKFVGGVCIIENITERKRAEEAYRTLVDHSLQGLAIFQDGRVVFANQAMAEISGYTVEEMLALSPEQVQAFVHPEDRELVWGRHRDRLNGEAVPERYELRGIRKNGLLCWLEIHASRIEYQGKPAIQAAYIDITERKRGEEALRAERDKAQKYLDVAGVMFVAIDVEGKVTLINKKGCEILGYGEKEIVGKNWFGNFLPGRIRDEVRGVNEKVIKGELESVEYYENPILTKNGDERLIAWHNTILQDGKGEAVGSLSSGEDITDRKHTEEQIEKLARFPAENPNPVLRISARGTVIYGNEASSPLLKFWQCRINGSVSGCWYEFVLDALSSGQSQQTEVQCDGQTFSLAFTPVMDSNYVNVYGLDITDRKKAEEEVREGRDYLESLTNSMWDAVFSVKMPERVIEWVNDSFRLTGYEPEDCVGSTTEFLYPDKSEFIDFGNKLQKAINTGEDVLHAEQLLRRKNGEIFPAEITTTFFRTKGKITGLTSIVRDITERKDAEKRLLDYQEQLKSLASQLTLTEEQERRRIATDLHDNITQSLAMSKLKLDLVRDSKSSSSVDLAEVLNETSRNIEQIMQGVRTLTFDLSSPVLYELGFEAAVAEWLTERIQKEHGIATEFEDDGQPKPLDDDTRTVLFRDVRELLTNVVKHAQANKVKVSVRKVGSRIHVIVEDDGRGFDPKKVAATAAKAGVFGLFSIRERLKQFGGNIEIESASGHGTRVILTAPLKSES